MAELKVKDKKIKLKPASKKAVKKEVVKNHTVEKGKSVVVKVFDIAGKVSGSISLPGEMFAQVASSKLIAQAIRVYSANQRAGNAKTKTRGEVEGSTKKIYRQKGTGKARHGARKAPIFVGGGVALGPVPHSFSLKLNKKMRQKALFAAFSDRAKNGKIYAFDFEGSNRKTKQLVNAFKNMDLVKKNGDVNKVLFVTSAKDVVVSKAARNIEGLDMARAHNVNIFEVLKNSYIIFAKNAIEELKNTFKK